MLIDLDGNTAIKKRNAGTFTKLRSIKPVNSGKLIYEHPANMTIDAMDHNPRLKHVDAAYTYLLNNSKNNVDVGNVGIVVFVFGWLVGLGTVTVAMKLMEIL